MNFGFSKTQKPLKRLPVFQKAMDEYDEKPSAATGVGTVNSAKGVGPSKPPKKSRKTLSSHNHGNTSVIAESKEAPNDKMKNEFDLLNDAIECNDFNGCFQSGINFATNGKYGNALRSFDLAIRFWGMKMEQLKFKHKIEKDFIIDSNKLDNINVNDSNIFNLISQTFSKQLEKQDSDLIMDVNDIKQNCDTNENKSNDNNNNNNNNNDSDDDNDEIIYFENIESDEDNNNGNNDDKNGNNGNNENNGDSELNDSKNTKQSPKYEKGSNDENEPNGNEKNEENKELNKMIAEIKQLSTENKKMNNDTIDQSTQHSKTLKNGYPCTNGHSCNHHKCKELDNDNDNESNEKVYNFILNNDDNLPNELKEHMKIGSQIFEAQSQVLMELDRDFESIESCKQAIILRPNWSVAWLTLSRAELNWGDPIKSYKSSQYALHCINFEMNNENNENNKKDELLQEIKEHCSMVAKIALKYQELKKTGQISDQQIYSRVVMPNEMKSNDDDDNEKSRLQQMDKAMIKQRMKMRKEKKLDHESRKAGKTFTTQNLAQKLSKLQITQDDTSDDINNNESNNTQFKPQ